jgi:hypothetical protein
VQGTWLGLLTVIAAGAPATLAAYWSHRGAKISKENGRQLVTGNDKTVGEMVTEVHGKESQQNTDFNTHSGTDDR